MSSALASMTNEEVAQLPIEEQFELVRGIVTMHARRWWQRWGGEFEDVFQQACLEAVRALNSYDPTRTKLSTHVYFCVYMHVGVFQRTRSRQDKMGHARHEYQEDTQFSPHAELDWIERLDGVSELAVNVYKAIVNNDVNDGLPAQINKTSAKQWAYECCVSEGVVSDRKEFDRACKELKGIVCL